MARAMDCARAAGRDGETPVGAAVCDPAGNIVAAAGNRIIAENDPAAHAEILALRAAARTAGNCRLPGFSLYATLEPCAMCAGAAFHARVGRIVFAAPDPKTGALGGVVDLSAFPALNHHATTSAGLMADESAALLRDFFRARRRGE